ncbi:hypothetical protein SDC9_09099 [bioreactor metagenome]|uniref:Uncharacterized protein n=1 Tax=bioreactor metagenome TaxID=1076179 RepID=A0A644TC68_9ZZZZ|nr:hypothetical protein [Negativicutes bacterium]
MKQIMKTAFALLVALFVTTISSSPVQAASAPDSQDTIKLTVNVNIDQPDIFWNYTFLTKDADLGKPEKIKLIWSRGSSPSKEKTETMLITDKASASTTIITNKGEIVNLRVCVYGPKNMKINTIDLQVRNSGQSETVNISPPEYTEPYMSWGNY